MDTFGAACLACITMKVRISGVFPRRGCTALHRAKYYTKVSANFKVMIALSHISLVIQRLPSGTVVSVQKRKQSNKQECDLLKVSSVSLKFATVQA